MTTDKEKIGEMWKKSIVKSVKKLDWEYKEKDRLEIVLEFAA